MVQVALRMSPVAAFLSALLAFGSESLAQGAFIGVPVAYVTAMLAGVIAGRLPNG